MTLRKRPWLPVKLHQRQGLAFIAFQTLRDNFFRVVDALKQLRTTDVANAFILGRLGDRCCKSCRRQDKYGGP